MKCLVTGGAGFIGSHLVDQLIQDNHSVLVVDNLSNGRSAQVHHEAEFVKGDITDFDLMRAVMGNMDVVFHMAALPRIQRAIDDPMDAFKSNVLGTMTVFEAAHRNHIPRVIYSSSSSVYGDNSYWISDTDGPYEFMPMHEDMPCNPLSLYAAQKLHGEHIAQNFAKAYGMQFVALRYFNVYGPRQVMEGQYCLVLGKFMQQKKEGKKLTIYGDGEQTRAYTWVGDVVNANILAMNHPAYEEKFEVFNVGTDKEQSVNEVAALVGGEVDHIIPNPRGQFEEQRKSADWGKIRDVLGWKPSIELAEGVAITMKMHENK